MDTGPTIDNSCRTDLIRTLATELSEIMNRIRQLHEEQSQVLVDLDEAAMMADYDAIREYRKKDGKVLYRLIDEERQRSIVSDELAQVIGVVGDEPFRIVDAIDEIPAEVAKSLTDLGMSIEDQAHGLRAQNRLGELLMFQSFDQVEVFLSPGAQHLVEQESNTSHDSEPPTPSTRDRLDPSI